MAATDTPVKMSERSAVILHRYLEARKAGLTPNEARIFAHDNGIDVGELRRLIKRGCPKEWLAGILF